MIVYSRELKAGMKLKQPIYYGNFILIDKENLLTDQIIEKVLGYGINYVDIYEDAAKKEEELKQVLEHEGMLKDAFKSNYDFAVENTKIIIENIKNGKIDKQKIEEVVDETIGNLEIDKSILMGLLESKLEGDYLFIHTINTLTFSLTIGMALGYDQRKLKLLGKAALLHDVGMSKIPKGILTKEDKLSDEEIGVIKKHSVIGAELAGSIEKEVIEAIKYHHERNDGSGYPEGLSGDKIPEMARIIAIADVYSALTEDRVYRSKYSYYDAMKIMMQASINALDSKILKRFLNYMPIYPINSLVYLNDGRLGKVVKSNQNPFRPVVDVEEKGKIDRIDLSSQENLTKYIERVNK